MNKGLNSIKQKRILFVLPRMVAGGVERVTINLVKEFQKNGIICAVALRRCYGEFLEPIKNLCQVFEISPKNLIWFAPNLSSIIKAWQPTHIITPFVDIGILTYFAIKKTRLDIEWIHTVHSSHNKISAKKGFHGSLRYHLDQIIASIVYKHADKIVTVSNGIKKEIIDGFACDIKKITNIYNPCIYSHDIVPIYKIPINSAYPPRLLAIGRLTKQKGFDLLIDALQYVPQPWMLNIWGEGEEKNSLQEQIDRLNLTDYIKLKGHTDTPIELMRLADLFILPSRFEGFGIVLIEALAAQCNIIATDCPQGPKEILGNNQFGLLVNNNNPDQLIQAIKDIISKKFHVNSTAMIKRANEFTIESSILAWINLINNKI